MGGGTDDTIDVEIRASEVWLPGRSRLVALHGGEPVGNLEFQRTGEELTVWNVRVDADVRRQGIATCLAEHMLEQHPDVTRLRLHHVSDDGRAFWTTFATDHDLALETFLTPPPQP